MDCRHSFVCAECGAKLEESVNPLGIQVPVVDQTVQFEGGNFSTIRPIHLLPEVFVSESRVTVTIGGTKVCEFSMERVRALLEGKEVVRYAREIISIESNGSVTLYCMMDGEDFGGYNVAVEAIRVWVNKGDLRAAVEKATGEKLPV